MNRLINYLICSLCIFSFTRTGLLHSQNSLEQITEDELSISSNDSCEFSPTLLSVVPPECFSGQVVSIYGILKDSASMTSLIPYYLLVRESTQQIEIISRNSQFGIADSGHFSIMEVQVEASVNLGKLIKIGKMGLDIFEEELRILSGCNLLGENRIPVLISACEELSSQAANDRKRPSALTDQSELIEEEIFTLFPNPTTNSEVTLTAKNIRKGLYEIRVFDSNGRVVKSIRYPELSSETQINMGNLAVGLYLFQIHSPEGNTNTLSLTLSH